MANVSELKATAKESAEFRGHTLGEWKCLDYVRWLSQCTKCQKQVIVNTRPQPNQIDIGGKAVALGCEDEG